MEDHRAGASAHGVEGNVHVKRHKGRPAPDGALIDPDAQGAAAPPRHPTAEALLQATERLLIEVGYAGLSTRRIVDAAGQSHGSIRYHFGTFEQLIVAVVDRQTELTATRQRRMYESDIPFRAKWQQAMIWFEEDLESGYPKLIAELQAAAWNVPACRAGLRHTYEVWANLLRDAIADAAREYGFDADDALLDGLAGLIRTTQGAMLNERLAGIDTQHSAIVALIERAISMLEKPQPAVDSTTTPSGPTDP